MASSTTEPVLASLCSTSSNAPRLSGALPGNTSTAVIQLGVGVHHNRRLVPVEAPPAALVSVAQLRRHAPTASGPCSPHP